jgi:hypothetical protein
MKKFEFGNSKPRNYKEKSPAWRGESSPGLLENGRRRALHCAGRKMPHAQNHRPRQPESGSDVYAPALLEKLATASASVL